MKQAIEVTELDIEIVAKVIATLTEEIDLLWDEDCDRALLDKALYDRGEYIGISTKLRTKKPAAALKDWEWLYDETKAHYTDQL